LAKAIEKKLGRGSHQRNIGLRAVEMTSDGQAVVPANYLQRLGNGALDEGRRFVIRIISEIRWRRHGC